MELWTDFRYFSKFHTLDGRDLAYGNYGIMGGFQDFSKIPYMEIMELWMDFRYFSKFSTLDQMTG